MIHIKKYQSRVEYILYIVKFTLTDLSNATSELSKFMIKDSKDNLKNVIENIEIFRSNKKLAHETYLK